MLCLVYDDTPRITVEKGHRVSLYISQRSSMLKVDVWQLWKLLTTQRSLARLARSGQIMTGKTLNTSENDDANVLFIKVLLMQWTNLKLNLKFGQR